MKDEGGRRVRALGVIPARGGSKRLPRKNVRDLHGIPLIAYTIRAARAATLLSDWLVSTEDREIADVAAQYGAPVPFMRPEALATDAIRNIDVLIHALEFMEAQGGTTYDIVVLLQPTAPIRNPAHIDEAVSRLWESNLPTLASVKGPYQKRDPILKRLDGQGVLRPYCEKGEISAREPFYIYNAALYAIKRDFLLKERRFVSESQVPLVMDELHSVDVDTEEDFMVAEAYLSYLNQQDKA